MKKKEIFQIVKDLPFDTRKSVFKSESADIFLLRPSKLAKRFEKYDVSKNFQIWLKEGSREFRPNHMRLFIDLNLRTRCKPDMKIDLLTAFDNIFYGKDPLNELCELERVDFEHKLNAIQVIGTLSQLFLIEQEYCYNKPSKYDPPTLFFQGWVRQFIDSPKEIDNMCMSVAKGNTPYVKYTKKEDRNHRDYHENLEPLWYIDKSKQSTLLN